MARRTAPPMSTFLIIGGGLLLLWYASKAKAPAAAPASLPALTPGTVLNLIEAQRAAEVGV